MVAIVSPVAYFLFVAAAVIGCTTLCVEARRNPGGWTVTAARALGLLLLIDAVTWAVGLVVQGNWSPTTSLPLALCNMAILVAAAACWWRTPVLVELTYFWGLAGTLQAVATPDLNARFPHLVFFQYTVGHLGIVVAAIYLVVGLRIVPRRGAVWRTFAISVAYTAFVGIVDLLTGANYMFLREPPSNWTLLRLLGPWPWYALSGCGVALVLFSVLNLPFWLSRRHRETEVTQTHRHVAAGS